MTTKIVNKIGLEAEVFVFDQKEKKPVFPGDYQLPCDDFVLLGEIRGAPGETVPETLSNFMKAFYEFTENMNVNSSGNLFIDFTKPTLIIPNDLHTATIKKGGGYKSIPTCSNIYGTEINSFSDMVTKKTGEIIGHKVGCGLHIHFSSQVTDNIKVKGEKQTDYVPMNLPLALRDSGEIASLLLYRKGKELAPVEYTVSAEVSRITKPVLKYFIERLDKEILTKHPLSNEALTRYRQKGYYELKPYGFEYRSLPFSLEVFNDLEGIVRFCFDLFKEL